MKMNQKQLFTSFTPDEKLQAFFDGFEIIEARKNRLMLVGWRVIRNRRHSQRRVHYVGDRRSPLPLWYRNMRKTMRHVAIMLCIGAATGGVISFVVALSPAKALLTVLMYEVAIVGLLYLPSKARSAHFKLFA